jgi:hypothetical protein
MMETGVDCSGLKREIRMLLRVVPAVVSGRLRAEVDKRLLLDITLYERYCGVDWDE